MNFVPCVTWVRRGIAASSPHKLQLPPEELKRLVNETKEYFTAGNEDSDEIDEEEETEEKDHETNDIVEEEEDSDFDSRYNLDSYDNDDDQNPLFTINDIAVHVDNKDDDYLTDEESEGDLEEKEDFAIKDTDNLLVVGHVEDSSSVLEIYVYNQEEDSFYVHHDIVLPSYPLAIEWLDFHASDDKPGNYVAIGDMNPVIKIWDLDVVDVLEADYNLGQKPKKKKAKKMKGGATEADANYHSDAVLSLSWNKLVRNLLASGSADSTVIIWDLENGNGLNQLSFHSNKVQALQWHPSESPYLLSGCTDGFLKLYDCRNNGESKSWKVTGEIEKVIWNISNSFKFLCSTDQGYIHSFDMRNDKVEHSFQAHKEAVTGLDISPQKPEVLISASMDRTLKVWDLNKFQIMKSMKLKIGSIYAAKVAPDLDLTVAVGGNYSSNNLKVIDVFKENNELESNVDVKDEIHETEEDDTLSRRKRKNKGKVKKETSTESFYPKQGIKAEKIPEEVQNTHGKVKKETSTESWNSKQRIKAEKIPEDVQNTQGVKENQASKCTVAGKHKRYFE